MSDGPLLIAHRAGNDPADVAPAVAAGADVIEIDVHLSGGRLEVRHPRRAGPVLWDRAGVRWAARRRPPALEEILERIPSGTTPMLDLKQGPSRLAPDALAACRRGGFDAVIVSSRRWELVDALRAEDGVRVVHSAAGRRELGRLLRGRPRVVCARRDLLGEEVVRTIRDGGREVMTWPVDDAADAARLGDWGVAGLICDDLALIARLAAGGRQ